MQLSKVHFKRQMSITFILYFFLHKKLLKVKHTKKQNTLHRLNTYNTNLEKSPASPSNTSSLSNSFTKITSMFAIFSFLEKEYFLKLTYWVPGQLEVQPGSTLKCNVKYSWNYLRGKQGASG